MIDPTAESTKPAYAKIRRAIEHVTALKAVIANERREHPHRYEYRSNLRGAAGNPVVWIEWRVTGLRPALSPAAAVVFGDIVQNLRAALDYLAWALVVDDSRTRDPRSVAFPIVTDRRRLDGTLRRLERRYSPEALAVIAEVQPAAWDDPLDHPLAVLQALSNQDKHRLLHILKRAQVDLRPVRVTPEPPGGVRSWVNSGPLSPGDVVARVEWDRPPFDATVDVMPTFAYGEAVDIDFGTEVRQRLLQDIGPAMQEQVTEVFWRLHVDDEGAG